MYFLLLKRKNKVTLIILLNKEEKNRISLIEERSGKVTEIAEGSEVRPESYLLKIERDGYEPDLSKHIIEAREEPYQSTRRLAAAPRKIVTRIVAEYPAPSASTG